MRIVQLMASPFVGGPEQQMLGIAENLPSFRTVFLSFAEHGRAWPFLNEARRRGFQAVALESNTPHIIAAVREVSHHLRHLGADLLCCSGYKSDLVGWLAARRVSIPVLAIAHGWTGATLKVKWYEALDRRVMRWMDRTVCVSAAQAEKVRRAGVPAERVRVICNAIDADALPAPDAGCRQQLLRLFRRPPRVLVGAAGRLSPEKGFEVLVDAAAVARAADSGLGFVLFGDGPRRAALQERIKARGLEDGFVLAGFRADVRRFLPQLDLFALSSFTEGLPVVLLEAFAARLPVVATAVGGVPEVVEEGTNGYLVPAGDAPALARRLLDLARSPAARAAFGERGRQRVREEFSVARQGEQYRQLFEEVTTSTSQGRGSRGWPGKFAKPPAATIGS